MNINLTNFLSMNESILLQNDNLSILSSSLQGVSDLFTVNLGLDLVSLGAIISGILVITTKNPVISVLYLIALFINVAGYLILLGIHFIGLAYLIVYVGAIAILFIFVIMLMNIKLSELYTKDNSNSFPLGLIVGLSFLYPIYNQIVNTIRSSVSYLVGTKNNDLVSQKTNLNNIINSNIPQLYGESRENTLMMENTYDTFLTPSIQGSLAELGFNPDNSHVNLWDAIITPLSSLSTQSQIIYADYAILLLLISILLLISMVGAIILSLKPLQNK